ncbi:MAG: Ig-like domain repeat protein [Elusimicrobia bacterium]|nr:Ig-like domain repeat protein [Elusimicrobiota bacterium]
MSARESILGFLVLAAASHAAAQTLLFSPNGDGIKDQVTFKLSLQENIIISSWVLDIREPAFKGQAHLVKKFEGKGQPPKEIRWEGKDLSNRLVKDGTYFYSLSLETPAGNQSAITPSPLIVDRVPPQAAVAVDMSEFSPNGDGNKDEAQFVLKGADENGLNGWLLTIKDKEGAPARSLRGKGPPPPVLRWDGHGDFEEDVPDGVYGFELMVEDLAGNRTVSPPQSIIVNRRGLVSTVEVSPRVFSPNNDGIKEEVVFKIVSGSPESVERWELRVLNVNGKPMHKFEGTKDPPGRIVWNGLAGGRRLPDGAYQVVLSETDRAGNTATTPAQPLDLDTTPPTLAARIEPDLISPNGDRVKDDAVFWLKAEDSHLLESWTLSVLNDIGRSMRTFAGPAGTKPAEKLSWAGQGDGGQNLIDGVYNLVLEAVDIAGNKASTPKQPFRIDVTPPQLSVSADAPLFSPNLSQLSFALSVLDAGKVDSWNLAIKDAQGRAVRTFTGPAEAIPSQLQWDGKSQDRAFLPDGPYTFRLQAKDAAGNASESPEQKVTIGATAPKPQVAVDLRAISPNADGVKDSALFKMQSPSFNPLKEWTFRIWDRDKAAQRTIQGRGDVPGSLPWQGERDDKRPLPDGEYQFQLEVLDLAGNRVKTLEQPIRIDTTNPELSAQASPNLFSPNKDGFKDESVLIPSYRDASAIGEWKITIQDARRNPVQVFSGEGKLPLSIPWNGRAQDGKLAPDGAYTFVFRAEDEVGNRSATAEQIIKVDNSAPEVALQADKALFSPDGVKDVTTFLLDYKDASDISKWSLSIGQGVDKIPKTFTGVGRPPRNFPWNGTNDRGQIVPDGKYAAVLSITDEVGNTGKSAEVMLTVDTSKPVASVVAETDPLQEIALPMTVSQTPDKDIVISLESEVLFDTGQDNIKTQAWSTLMKANHLVRRYPQRKVRIEGHADNVPIHNERFRNNLELSKARAKAVMQFLIEQGKIDPARISSDGYGDAKPQDSNSTESGRRKNRRVEIVLVKEGK